MQNELFIFIYNFHFSPIFILFIVFHLYSLFRDEVISTSVSSLRLLLYISTSLDWPFGMLKTMRGAYFVIICFFQKYPCPSITFSLRESFLVISAENYNIRNPEYIPWITQLLWSSVDMEQYVETSGKWKIALFLCPPTGHVA